MRLIDAEHLMRNGWSLQRTGVANELLQTMSLADVFAIDAVPVVRCKDCKHKYNPDSPDWLWCYFVDTAGDDFCSYGERKDGE